jgi:hypothetical protein
MYVIKDTEHSATLMEMTRKEYEEARAGEGGYFTPTLFSHISAQRAHAWVKEGGHHSTNLYINEDGRIRRARCPEKEGY